jgi:hypothetical protein
VWPRSRALTVISCSALCPSKWALAPFGVEGGDSCCPESSPILASRRHSSVVEQLFRKSPALCAVLPRVAEEHKSAHLSAESVRAPTASDGRCRPFSVRPIPAT